MSLVTLGSAPYNPYNTSLAEMAVTGMKLGMENLDRMEENDRFSLNETSKAFAAVTDNLFKVQTLQLQKKESDRADRAQSFREYEFGEKMAFDKDRAKTGDTQWLQSFQQRKAEFADTKIRTGLLAEEGKQRKAEFVQKQREFAEGAPLQALERAEAIKNFFDAPNQRAIARDEEQGKAYLAALTESLKATNKNIDTNEAMMNTIKGYEKEAFAASGGNPLTASSAIGHRGAPAPVGPPVGPRAGSEVGANAAIRAETAAMMGGDGTQSRNPKEYTDHAYTKRVQSQLAYDYEVQRRIMQLTSVVAANPRALRDEKVFKLKGELESLFASGMRDKFLDEKDEKRTDWNKASIEGAAE